MCVLYSIVAQSLDMPVYGVNLPNHFILTYLDEDQMISFIDPENKYGNLFYINAFSKGGIFDVEEIRAFLKGLDKPELREYFEPCSNSAIIKRMITNLINSFQQVGNSEKVNDIALFWYSNFKKRIPRTSAKLEIPITKKVSTEIETLLF